jgi:hypothetical protein
MSATRTEIRRAIGDKTGDMMVLTATEDSATTGTITDTVRMGARGDNAPSLINRILYVPSQEHEARTTGFQSNTKTLSFSPVLDTALVEGEEAELWSIADRIGDIGTIHRMINTGIHYVRDIVGEEFSDTSVTFNASDPYVTIPSDMYEVGGIDWADPRGRLREIRSDHVRLRGRDRQIEIRKRGMYYSHGRTITLWGYRRAQPLTSDDDETEVDMEWIVESVASLIALGAQSWKATDRAAEERRANYWGGQAMMYRRKVGLQRRGWGLRV